MSGSLPSSPNSTPNSRAHRRPSYATVAANAAGLNPARFNTLSALSAQLTNASLPFPQPPPQITRQRSRSSVKSMEMDGQGSGGNGPYRRPGSGYANEPFRHDGRLGCAMHEEHPPFFTPSYLRHSRYVHRIRRAWEAHVAELLEKARMNPPALSTQQHSLSTSSSNANLSKMHAQHAHRAPVQDVVERIPPPQAHEDRMLRLPSRWSEVDKMNGIDIMAEGTEVRFAGVPKTTDEAVSVRSDHPMPRECGLYYFEVTVLSRMKDGLIGIGFSEQKVALSRLPGWEAGSWAYHGDDGYSFACTASGKPYGPRYASQDVIGCGVNFRTGSAFFTKNGVNLGVAFTGLKSDRLYPSVGMKKAHEHLRVNFGKAPFVFDIDRVMEQERQIIMGDISRADLSSLHPPDSESALIHSLIGQYLAHEGYVETAKAFAEDVHSISQSFSSEPIAYQAPASDDDIQALNRQKTRRAILDGDIDKALKYVSSFYPHVLEEDRNKDVCFRLRCRKFIEMAKRYTDLHNATTKSTATNAIESNGFADGEDERIDGQGEQQDTQMELDDQLHREASEEELDLPPTNDVNMDAPTDFNVNGKQKEALTEVLRQVLAYGQELQSAFGGDPRPYIKKELSDVFAILAYPDPHASVVGSLLDPLRRVQIAEEVNGAILVSLGKPPSAALEKLSAQTEALLDDTAAKVGGGAAFINVQRDFLHG